MKTIYKHHSAAFNRVLAAVLVYDGKQLGNIAFKYPADGAGRVYCYLHIHGDEMVRGFAGGYGYDKQGAAFESAIAQYTKQDNKNGVPVGFLALSDLGGQSWNNALSALGVSVMYAV